MLKSNKTDSNEVIFGKICELISNSNRGLRSICLEVGITPKTIYDWIDKNDELLKQYARAKELQADYLVDEMIEISDDTSQDIKFVTRGEEEVEVENREFINRSRLRVDTRKWIASKLRPKKYGDKLDLTSKDNEIKNIPSIVVTDLETANELKKFFNENH